MELEREPELELEPEREKKVMIPVPRSLSYLPFQSEGIELSRDKACVLLGDEPRLGKTIQACGWINCHPEIEEVLVVCPATLKINWARELDKWVVSPFVRATIINYDILDKLDFSKRYDLCILDEAHVIKNAETKRSGLCRKIRAVNRLALSATPFLNRPIELWHILHWLFPKRWPDLKSRQHFSVQFCNGHYGPRGWDDSGASHLEELKELLKPLMIRRLKKDVIKDLPPMQEQIIEIPTDGFPKDLRLAFEFARERIEGLSKTYADDAKSLEAAVRLEWFEMAEARHELGRLKAPMAVEFIRDCLESEQKMVVFAYHKDVIEEIQMGLGEFFPAVIHGGVPSGRRQPEIDRFQKSEKCRVFIGQIQAAGVGIKLSAATRILFVEDDWTPGVMTQAMERCFEMGKVDPIFIQHLVVEGSLDAYMAERLVEKRRIIDKVLG